MAENTWADVFGWTVDMILLLIVFAIHLFPAKESATTKSDVVTSSLPKRKEIKTSPKRKSPKKPVEDGFGKCPKVFCWERPYKYQPQPLKPGPNLSQKQRDALSEWLQGGHLRQDKKNAAAAAARERAEREAKLADRYLKPRVPEPKPTPRREETVDRLSAVLREGNASLYTSYTSANQVHDLEPPAISAVKPAPIRGGTTYAAPAMTKPYSAPAPPSTPLPGTLPDQLNLSKILQANAANAAPAAMSAPLPPPSNFGQQPSAAPPAALCPSGPAPVATPTPPNMISTPPVNNGTSNSTFTVPSAPAVFKNPFRSGVPTTLNNLGSSVSLIAGVQSSSNELMDKSTDAAVLSIESCIHDRFEKHLKDIARRGKEMWLTQAWHEATSDFAKRQGRRAFCQNFANIREYATASDGKLDENKITTSRLVSIELTGKHFDERILEPLLFGHGKLQGKQKQAVKEVIEAAKSVKDLFESRM